MQMSEQQSDGILQIDDVTKQFGGLTAVDEVDVSIEEGEMFGLIGPNGSGKTTLFKLIFGVLPVTSGRIVFQGEDITGLSIHDIANRGISQFYQESTLMQDVSVRENVRVSMVPNTIFRFRGSREHDDRIEETLELTELTHVADDDAEDLTHKEKQKLELAKAIVRDPDLLLLDEPFAGLTKDEADEIIAVIKQLNEDGMTILTVDHNLRWLRSFVERIVVLNNGRVIADGPPDEIVADEQVQSAYIGSRSGDEL